MAALDDGRVLTQAEEEIIDTNFIVQMPDQAIPLETSAKKVKKAKKSPKTSEQVKQRVSFGPANLVYTDADYAASVASSIRKIILQSTNGEFRHECFRKLNAINSEGVEVEARRKLLTLIGLPEDSPAPAFEKGHKKAVQESPKLPRSQSLDYGGLSQPFPFSQPIASTSGSGISALTPFVRHLSHINPLPKSPLTKNRSSNTPNLLRNSQSQSQSILATTNHSQSFLASPSQSLLADLMVPSGNDEPSFSILSQNDFSLHETTNSQSSVSTSISQRNKMLVLMSKKFNETRAQKVKKLNLDNDNSFTQ